MKGVMRFGKKGKLSPKFLGHYKILKRICRVDYMFEFLADFAALHPIFHISIMRKCVGHSAFRECGRKR